MAVTAEQLGRELRAFDGRRQVVQAMRRGITRGIKTPIAAVKAHAADILPSTGGLNRWVAAARIGVKISYGARSAGVKLRGGRKSLTDKSDLAAIDRGRVRAPSWGKRTQASWHTVLVTPGWWTTPLEADTAVRDAVEAEVDRALDTIRNG
jgi:hypothetical protein